MDIPKILMGRENPNGWKLESLLEILQNEIQAKSDLIKDSNHDKRDLIIANNDAICNMLFQAQEIQKSTYRELDENEPNKGPLHPRL